MNKHFYPLCMIALSLLGWLLVWTNVPAALPKQLEWIGQVGTSPSFVSAFFLINGVLIGVYILMAIVPKIFPRKTYTKTYYAVQDTIISLLFLISAAVLAICIGSGKRTVILAVTTSMGVLLTLIVNSYLIFSVSLMIFFSALFVKIHRRIGQAILNKFFKESVGANR